MSAIAGQITQTNYSQPSSTYIQSANMNNEHILLGIENYSMEVDAWNKGAKINLTIKTSEVPTSIEHLINVISDDYLKTQGLPDTLQEMIAKHYPEYKI